MKHLALITALLWLGHGAALAQGAADAFTSVNPSVPRKAAPTAPAPAKQTTKSADFGPAPWGGILPTEPSQQPARWQACNTDPAIISIGQLAACYARADASALSEKTRSSIQAGIDAVNSWFSLSGQPTLNIKPEQVFATDIHSLPSPPPCYAETVLGGAVETSNEVAEHGATVVEQAVDLARVSLDKKAFLTAAINRAPQAANVFAKFLEVAKQIIVEKQFEPAIISAWNLGMSQLCATELWAKHTNPTSCKQLDAGLELLWTEFARAKQQAELMHMAMANEHRCAGEHH